MLEVLKVNYFIKTYGCQMNVHESEKIAGILSQCGYTEGSDEASADILVYNTCCIRETAEQKIYGNLGLAKNYKKKNPNLIVVLVGCMTQQLHTIDNIKSKYSFVDIVLGTTNLHMLPEAIAEASSKHKTFNIDMTDYANRCLPKTRTSMPNGWVNIIYGCNNFCTYCIVPHVRGREQSRPMVDVVDEVQELLAQGYKEITLLGQNVNSYGHDLADGSTFAKLMDTLGALPTKYRLRFMTSHPKDLTSDVIDVIAKHDNICNYIHLPVQSGSTNILSAMNRKYSRQQYLSLLDDIRAKIPDIGITTDIMVGFPGESQQDFEDSLDLINTANLSSSFCFIYSRRKGTPAYDMPNQIPYSIKQQRVATLINAQKVVTKRISATMIGNSYEVLVEDYDDVRGQLSGRMESGRLVKFDSSNRSLIGQFVQIYITSARSATLYGKLIGE